MANNMKQQLRQWQMLWRLSHFKWYDLLVNILLYGVQVYLVVKIPQMMGRLIDKFLETSDTIFQQMVQQTLLAIILACVLQWGLGRFAQRRVYQQMAYLRYRLMREVQISDLQAFMDLGSEKIPTHLIDDVNQVTNGLLLLWTQLWSATLLLILSLVQMLMIHLVLGIGVLVLTPIPLVVAHFLSQTTYRFARQQAQERSELFTREHEWLNVLPLVQQYQWQEEVVKQLSTQASQYYQTSFRATFFSSLVNPTTRLLNGLLYTLMVALGAMAMLQGKLSLGTWVAFLSYMAQFAKPFNELSHLWSEWLTALASGERLVNLMQLPTISMGNGTAEIPIDVVSFEHLSFSYDGQQQVLDDIVMRIEVGMHVAIVGATGSGKSTLMNILMRFYEATQGEVRLANRRINHFSLQEWYRYIGYIPQDAWVFQGTIADNIAFAKVDATREAIVKAAELAGAKRWIEHLPNGIDTMIGDGVTTLSQGQIQILMIARMFLRQPMILVLDEATASLDAYTEQRVQQALEQLMVGRTTFTIAHRLATIQQADLILVMSQGKIIEVGTHSQLIAQQGIYAQLQKNHEKSSE